MFLQHLPAPQPLAAALHPCWAHFRQLQPPLTRSSGSESIPSQPPSVCYSVSSVLFELGAGGFCAIFVVGAEPAHITVPSAPASLVGL